MDLLPVLRVIEGRKSAVWQPGCSRGRREVFVVVLLFAAPGSGEPALSRRVDERLVVPAEQLAEEPDVGQQGRTFRRQGEREEWRLGGMILMLATVSIRRGQDTAERESISRTGRKWTDRIWRFAC